MKPRLSESTGDPGGRDAERCGATSDAADAGHIPVLVQPLIEHLALPEGGVVVDATVGLGGHASAILDKLGEKGRLVGLDVDAGNLSIARARLAPWGDRVSLHRRNFSEVRLVLDELGIPGVHAVVADLGVSSNQLDDPGRGLSFMADGPLDMRLDDRIPGTAADLVNAMPERDLGDLFYNLGQERFSRRIAKRICQARRDARIRRTGDLARIVCSAVGADPHSHKSRIHPATRVFLALRIAVNREVENLESFLKQAYECLLPPGASASGGAADASGRGGRLAVISFQSIEDGIVKRDFRQREAAGQYRICTKKPVASDGEEIRRNPRARSAKLRVAERVA